MSGGREDFSSWLPSILQKSGIALAKLIEERETMQVEAAIFRALRDGGVLVKHQEDVLRAILSSNILPQQDPIGHPATGLDFSSPDDETLAAIQAKFPSGSQHQMAPEDVPPQHFQHCASANYGGGYSGYPDSGQRQSLTYQQPNQVSQLELLYRRLNEQDVHLLLDALRPFPDKENPGPSQCSSQSSSAASSDYGGGLFSPQVGQAGPSGRLDQQTFDTYYQEAPAPPPPAPVLSAPAPAPPAPPPRPPTLTTSHPLFSGTPPENRPAQVATLNQLRQTLKKRASSQEPDEIGSLMDAHSASQQSSSSSGATDTAAPANNETDSSIQGQPKKKRRRES